MGQSVIANKGLERLQGDDKVAEIDLSALMHNLGEVKRCISPSCAVMAIVKADAYGHGAIEVSRALVQGGVRRLGVSSVAEGVQLREAGITVPILVMGGVWTDHLQDLRGNALTPVIYDMEMYKEICSELNSSHPPLSVHLKVDTGMRRLGLSSREVVEILLESGHNISIEGLMTHLSHSEIEDGEVTNHQLSQFNSLTGDLRSHHLNIPLCHLANSAAIMRAPDTHMDLVRPGLMLYGYSLAKPTGKVDLWPVLSLKTRIVQIKSVRAGEMVGYGGMFQAKRDSRIAILPIGYADGYNRALSDRGKVLIGGKLIPIAGRVSMNMTAVDITDHKNVKHGDEVMLLGAQGQEAITAADIAQQLDTIPYEVLCWVGSQFPRRYLSKEGLTQ